MCLITQANTRISNSIICWLYLDRYIKTGKPWSLNNINNLVEIRTKDIRAAPHTSRDEMSKKYRIKDRRLNCLKINGRQGFVDYLTNVQVFEQLCERRADDGEDKIPVCRRGIGRVMTKYIWVDLLFCLHRCHLCSFTMTVQGHRTLALHNE